MVALLRLYHRWLRRKAYRARRQFEGSLGENFPAVFFRTL